MKTGSLTIVIALLFVCTIFGQSVNKERLNEEMRLGGAAYGEGNFKEAEAHFRAAKMIDPTDKKAALSYAQSIDAQLVDLIGLSRYVAPPPPPPGQKATTTEPTEQEIATATRALEAFKGALTVDPENVIIYQSIARIYDFRRDYEMSIQWLFRASELPNVKPPEKRDVFYVLGVKMWERAYQITSRWADSGKGSDRADDPTYRIYLRSDFPPEERAKAEKYASDGLDLLNKALAIDPSYANAYPFLALLNREMAKLARNPADKSKYLAEWQKAVDKFQELSSYNEKKEKPN